MQELWEEAEKLTKDSETTARIIGVKSQMATFDFYFGVYIGEMILRYSDNLSKALQKKDISAAEGQHVAQLVKVTLQTMHSAQLVKVTLQTMHSESSFSLFWQVLTIKAQKLNIGEPELPRKRKAPKEIWGWDRRS